MEKIKIQVIFYIQKNLDEIKYFTYEELTRLWRCDIFIYFPVVENQKFRQYLMLVNIF